MWKLFERDMAPVVVVIPRVTALNTPDWICTQMLVTAGPFYNENDVLCSLMLKHNVTNEADLAPVMLRNIDWQQLVFHELFHWPVGLRTVQHNVHQKL